MKILVLLGILAISMIFLSACEEEEVEEEEVYRPRFSGRGGFSKKTPAGVGFKLDIIENNGDADILFKSFLEKLMEEKVITDKVFKISDITKYIPYNREQMEISEDKYNYLVLTMLSSQINRDYFIYLEGPNLRHEFTNICNDPERNNSIWKTKYKDVEFRINPKYVRR